MEKTSSHLLLALISLLFLASSASAAVVNISAAASLKDVMNELSASFAQKYPGVTFVKNYAASGGLAKQIENGVPADIFVSANKEWMEYLKSKKLVDENTISNFAYNELVFTGRPTHKAGSLKELVNLERIAIGSPGTVPAGEYAMEAFKNSGIDRQLGKKLVMAKDVRECLMYADRGEVDGSFVYKTDALLAGKNVKILFTVPQGLYPRVTYPVAMTPAGNGNVSAAAFFRFLLSAEARNLLAKYGFIVK